MPRQIIQKKEAPVMIKSNNNISSSSPPNILPSPEATTQLIRYNSIIYISNNLVELKERAKILQIPVDQKIKSQELRKAI